MHNYWRSDNLVTSKAPEDALAIQTTGCCSN